MKTLKAPQNRGKDAPDPNTVRVWLDVPRKTYRRASVLTAAYTLLSLGKVLEAWIEDAAHGASHLDSWEHKQLTKWLRGHPFPKDMQPRPKHRARRDVPEQIL